MAISLGDAILFLRGDDKDLDSTLVGAETKTSSWASKLGGTVSNLATGAILGGATLAAGAIIGIGAATFSVAGDVQAAQNQIQASLGVTEERAKELGDVATNVFANNFGGSIEEAAGYVSEAEKTMASFGGVSDEELQKIVEGSYALADVFETEIGGPEGTINGARVLMEKFGLGASDSLNLMATGMQKIPSDDLLASLTEYGPLFSELGFSADEMFSIFSSGAEAGVLGTDKIGDAFKEFGIIMNEGSEEAAGALSNLGMDMTEMYRAVARGEKTWADYFPEILSGLQSIEDPIDRNQVQVALFGTMAEDLGQSFAQGLDLAAIKLEDTAGATESLNAKYQTFGDMFEGFKRQALVALAPLAEKLLELGNKIMPILSDAFSSIMEIATPIIEELADAFGQFVQDLSDWFVPFFNDALLPTFRSVGDWLINEGWPAFQNFATPILTQVIPGLQQLATWGLQLAQFVWPLLQMAIQLVTDNMNIILPILAAVGLAIGLLSSPITMVVGAVVLLATAWANNWGGIQEKVQAVWEFISPLIESAMFFIQDVIQSGLALIMAWWDEHGASVWAIVEGAFNLIVSLIQEYLQSLQDTIQTILAFLQAFWQEWGDEIIALAQIAWDTITAIIRAATDTIGFIIDAIAALIKGDWQAFGEALMSIWNSAWDAIEAVLSGARDAILVAIGALIQIVSGQWDSFVEGIKLSWSGMWTSISDFVSGVQESIVSAVEGLTSAVSGVWETFTSGIETTWSGMWDNISSYVSGVVDTIKNALKPVTDAVQGVIDLIDSIPALPDIGLSRTSSFANINSALGTQAPSLFSTNNQSSQNNVNLNYFGSTPGDPVRDLRRIKASVGVLG